MEKIKNYLKTPVGKKVEKYMWEVLVLSIMLLVSAGMELNLGWVIFATPALHQVTKWINLNKIK